MINKRVHLGTVKKTHGLKGEVTILPNLPHPSYYERIKILFLHLPSGEERKVEVEKGRGHSKLFIIKLKGFDDIDSAALLKGAKIFADRQNVPAPPEGEYYYFDLIGLKVIVQEGERLLGRLEEIIETGANDVFVVKDTEKREYLIPGTKEVVKEVDIEKEVMTIVPLEGMID